LSRLLAFLGHQDKGKTMQHERETERFIRVEPGQELCECGQVIERDEVRACVHCGHRGCPTCLRLAHVEDADLNNEYVCGDECEAEWIEFQMRANERDYRNTQDRLGKQIDALRQKQEVTA
jgi:hypothetical protein